VTASVEQLAALIRRANSRGELLSRAKSLLDEVASGGREVAGDREIWSEAASLLAQVNKDLEQLDSSTAGDTLSRGNDLLESEEWEVLAETATQMAEVRQQQRKTLEFVKGLAQDLHVPIADARKALNEAHSALAPTRDAEAALQRIDDLRVRALRDAQEQPAAAIASRAALERARHDVESEQQKLRERIDRARLRLRHAELLLLRAPLGVERKFEKYTLLLRTPAEPGAHGVYVRGGSTLVCKDRAFVFQAIDKLTQVLREGALRKAAVSPPEAPIDPQPEMAPAAAPSEPAEPAAGESAPDALRGFKPIPPRARELSEGTISDLGDLLFKLFLPEEMQEFLSDTPCSLTLTTNDLELPWELMRIGGQALCLDRCIGRMPMGNRFPRRHLPQRFINPKVRFLLVCADDNGKLPGARAETDRIHSALLQMQSERTAAPGLGIPIEVDVLASPQATGSALTEKLRFERYNVIHFAGHASFDEQEPDQSGLLLDGGEMFLAQKIRRLLIGRPMVFLNACNSAQVRNQADAASDQGKPADSLKTYLQGAAEGLAASFLYGGALGCIGSLWPVYDEPAAEFAIAFYRNVLDGHVIGEAVRMARVDIKSRFPEHATWATFVLYGNPTFRLES
jgi:hypothetical protein